MISKYKSLKEECLESNMKLNELGLVLYTFGNVSAVDRNNAVFAIKPSGVPYEKLTASDIVVVDFDNVVVEGKLKPSSHAKFSCAWAQSLMDIPIFGTTHADHLTTDIPCTSPMKDELIKGNYEHNTAIQILETFEEKKISYKEVEMVLVGNHGSFTWGLDAQKSVYNNRVLEEIAELAFMTLNLNPNAMRLKDSLIQKHYDRKHGVNSYYGQ
jgi:L-ribulose-5-phosphate 4-epimerase